MDDRITNRGIAGREAAPWHVESWLSDVDPRFDVAALRGQVVVVVLFQAMCDGSRNTMLPLIVDLARQRRDADISWIALHTVFERLDENTPQAATDLLASVGFDGIVGHCDADAAGKLFDRYRSGGTPWLVVVDRMGVVRYNGHHATSDGLGALLDRLTADATESGTPQVRG